MGSDRFSFEMENGNLAWTYPAHAPDVTDDQARTLAIATLAHAVSKLAAAIRQYAGNVSES